LQFNRAQTGSFRKIKEIVTTSEVESIYINTDDNGNPFSLKELYIDISSVLTATNTADALGIINVNAGGVSFTNTNKLTDAATLMRKTTDWYVIVESRFFSSKWYSKITSRASTNQALQTVQGVVNPSITGPCTNITVGNASAVTHYYFGVGTKIIIWGVDS
jgi:hypothetical protein